MSGEDSKLNDWQNEERGAKVLSEMPSFDEHMNTQNKATDTKSFHELSPDERPEGVRDEKDYAEYLAEREAKREEYEKTDHEIIDGVRQIEDPNDRNLATAMLAACYNKYGIGIDGERSTQNLVGIEIMQAIIEYTKTDKPSLISPESDLDTEFCKFWKKYYDGGHSDLLKSNTVAELHRDFDELVKGCKIENISSTPEGTLVAFEFPHPYDEHKDKISFGNVELVGSYISDEKHKFVGNMRLNDERISALALAYDIKDRYDNRDDIKYPNNSEFYDRLVCITKLKILRNAFTHNFEGGVDGGLQEAEKNALDDIADKALEMLQDSHIDSGADLDSLKIPILGSGAFNLAMIQSVKRKLVEYEDLRKNYTYLLEKGEQILSGKDWRKIDPIY